MRRWILFFIIFVGSQCLAAFPSVSDITEDKDSSDELTHVISMPATVDVGDLLLLLICMNTSTTITTPSGWTELFLNAYDGNGEGIVYGKDAIGNEDGTTVDVVHTVGVDAGSHAAQTYRIAASSWGGDLATDVDVGTVATGTSDSPDPPSVSAGWGSADNLFIEVVCATDDDATASSYSTSYSNGVDSISGAGVNAGQTAASARRELAASSDDPGTATLSESEAWMANTIVIEPAASGVAPLAYYLQMHVKP